MQISTKIEIIISTIIAMMIFGTFIYHSLEGWGYVDSFYFTGITLTTIGYGDLYPTTVVSKIFTVFFAFVGVGILAASLSVFATEYFKSREQKMENAVHRRLLSVYRNKVNKKNKRAIVRGSRNL